MWNGPKGDTDGMSGADWRPRASRETLEKRAHLMHAIRAFFQARGVLEVETPCLLPSVAPELHQDPIPCQERFLHTSPEMAMKRLLAAGMGPIYQICHAFREGECGSLHNPEFSMLEWYRPGWTDRALREEVEALIGGVLAETNRTTGPAQVLTFSEAFRAFAGVDPLADSDASLADACHHAGPYVGKTEHGGTPPNRAEWLDRLLLQRVEPGLKAMGGAVFLVDFPPEAAAMAQLDPGPPVVARRFELYLDGVELANGYQELTDPEEQRQRFEQTHRQRQALGKRPLPMDEPFFQALTHGLPACSGVALGLDRLIMVALGAENIQAVMAFPSDRT